MTTEKGTFLGWDIQSKLLKSSYEKLIQMCVSGNNGEVCLNSFKYFTSQISFIVWERPRAFSGHKNTTEKNLEDPQKNTLQKHLMSSRIK